MFPRHRAVLSRDMFPGFHLRQWEMKVPVTLLQAGHRSLSRRSRCTAPGWQALATLTGRPTGVTKTGFAPYHACSCCFGLDNEAKPITLDSTVATWPGKWQPLNPLPNQERVVPANGSIGSNGICRVPSASISCLGGHVVCLQECTRFGKNELGIAPLASPYPQRWAALTRSCFQYPPGRSHRVCLRKGEASGYGGIESILEIVKVVGGGDRIHPETRRKSGRHGVQYVAQRGGHMRCWHWLCGNHTNLSHKGSNCNAGGELLRQASLRRPRPSRRAGRPHPAYPENGFWL